MLLVLRRAGAFALAIAVVLLVPALASAAEFKVTGTGDQSEAAQKTACQTGVGECTLRAAVSDANAISDPDTITFATAFDGGAGTTISLGSTLNITAPLTIHAAPAEISGKAVPAVTVQGTTAFQISAKEVEIEGLGIVASSIGVQILGGLGTTVRGNFISGVQGMAPGAGVEINSGSGSEGNLIEGNRIKVPGYYSWGIAVQDGPNRMFGNVIEAGGEGISSSGCCYQGIYLEMNAAGNRIGGDTPQSENVITGFWYGAIWVHTGNHNEIGRNRGVSTSSGFIKADGAPAAPTIAKAYPTKVSGTAEPNAKVRVFATPGSTGAIDGFLGEATASAGGDWTAPIAASTVGAQVTGTQTYEGSTSELVTPVAVETEPSSGGGGSGGDSGGGSNGGGTSTGSSTTPVTPPPVVTPAPPKAPTVKITSGPKKNGTATTVRFKVKAEPATGATFECKLDGSKWAKCTSPKTYKKLQVGKHTFRVRAIAGGLTGAATKYQFTVKS